MRYELVRSQLPKCYTKWRLLADTERIIGAPPPDRICRRSKPALICWFLEHAEDYLDRIIASSNRAKGDQVGQLLDLVPDTWENTDDEVHDWDDWTLG
jgi:hypothetical protein